MVWLAVDKDGRGHLFRIKPYRDGEQWKCHSTKEIPFPVLPVDLSAISMWLNITVDKLKWENEPIEIKEETKFDKVSTRIVTKSDTSYLTQEIVGKTKSKPKFKVGDILFYRGETCGYLKVEEIREENGEIRYYETSRNLYLVENDPNVFADKVCSVETEETKPIDFTIKTTDTKGKVEVVIPDGYGYEIENDKLYFITKKKEYPKTYTECSDILAVYTDPDIDGYKGELLWTFQKLLSCRDAYWKIAGEEMGLGKPWEPDWNKSNPKYTIAVLEDKLIKHFALAQNYILAFPTAKMRDAFYENFKEEIENCKELL